MNSGRRLLWALLFIIIVVVPLEAEYMLSNFNEVYDVTFRVPTPPQKKNKNFWWSLGSTIEWGSTEHSWNSCNDRVPLLNIFSPSESTLAMLSGNCGNPAAVGLLNQLNAALAMQSDDGCRGHIKFSGDYREWLYCLNGQLNWRIPHVSGIFNAWLYLPVHHRAVRNVCHTDCTPHTLSADQIVHELVTDNVCTTLQEAACLNIGSWSKTGFGDLVFLLGWYQDFRQIREHLQNVRLTFRAGLTFPTGAKRDENCAFSLPLGYDGAMTLPFTAGLDLLFRHTFKTGIEFQITKAFDETRCRRVKTDRCQTDFLLPCVISTRKQTNFTWKFNLYAGFENFLDGLSTFVHYQFVRRDDDQLFAHNTNAVNSDIMNTACSLQDWVLHNFIFQLSYAPLGKKVSVVPYVSLFYKLPVGGRRALAAHTWAVECAVSF